jgi:hypothetical protein
MLENRNNRVAKSWHTPAYRQVDACGVAGYDYQIEIRKEIPGDASIQTRCLITCYRSIRQAYLF